MTSTTTVSIGRHADRVAVVASLTGVTALAWLLTVQLTADMNMSSASMAMGMSSAKPSSSPQIWLVSAMWAAMMVGMMVPSATPMVVAFTDWTRRGPAHGSRSVAVTSFVSGYLIVWLGFSLVAAVIQVTLEHAGVLTGMGAISAPALGGAVLVAAGAFQVTRWKSACLRRCRTPVGFLIAEWRDGSRGAAVMGVRHGAYCLGCCWLLMAVMLVVGTMHLVWMAVVAGFVLAEKIAPPWMRTHYVAAASLVGWGTWTILAPGSL